MPARLFGAEPDWSIMAEPVNETQLVKKIIQSIKKVYPEAYILKIHGGPMQSPGIPDLLLCVNGLFVGMEVKHQKIRESEQHARERATPNQRIHIQKIMRASGMAGVVLSPEDALDMLERAHRKSQEILATKKETSP